MSAVTGFNTGRARNLWWMVHRDFEAPLAQLGLPRHETVEAWIESGSPASRGTTGRGQTYLLALPERREKLLLRRTLHGGVLGPIWRGHLGSPRRIQRELEVTSSLKQAGANVPIPVLGIAIGSRPLWRASIATLYIPDTMTGLDWLSSTNPDARRLQRVAASVGGSLGYFHGCGGQHADLHLGNILIREEEERVRTWIIDLDKARFDPLRSGHRPAELKRLTHSLKKRSRLPPIDPDIRDRFLHAYETGIKEGLDRTRH